MSSVIELGSCGLHIVYGAPRKLEWISLVEIFTKFFMPCGRFLTSHQQEEIFISEKHVCFLFIFKTRWVEDGPVASTAFKFGSLLPWSWNTCYHWPKGNNPRITNLLAGLLNTIKINYWLQTCNFLSILHPS